MKKALGFPFGISHCPAYETRWDRLDEVEIAKGKKICTRQQLTLSSQFRSWCCHVSVTVTALALPENKQHNISESKSVSISCPRLCFQLINSITYHYHYQYLNHYSLPLTIHYLHFFQHLPSSSGFSSFSRVFHAPSLVKEQFFWFVTTITHFS